MSIKTAIAPDGLQYVWCWRQDAYHRADNDAAAPMEVLPDMLTSKQVGEKYNLMSQDPPDDRLDEPSLVTLFKDTQGNVIGAMTDNGDVLNIPAWADVDWQEPVNQRKYRVGR